MFRDRVVSMEQTLEGGEKHLELLKTLCREALPEFEYVAHSLDHERDLFVMDLVTPDAAVDEHPFAVPADGHGDGLHRRTAIRVPIARVVVVEVTAPEAVGTVVAMRGAGRVEPDVEAAVAASERIGASARRARTLLA